MLMASSEHMHLIGDKTMAEFDINKVLTIKDYLINPNCIEVGKRYYLGDTLDFLEINFEKKNDYFSGIYKGVHKTNQNRIDGFIAKNTTWQYLYPCEDLLKEYRPFKRTELINLLGSKLLDKAQNIISIALAVDEHDYVRLSTQCYNAEDLLDRFKILNADGTTSPCGVLVEEE